MKFAICNETFLDWPLDRAFAFARECGYTGIEIAPFTLDYDARRISAAQRAEVCRLATEADLQVIGLHWLLAKTEGFYLTTPDAAVRRATSAYLGDLARLCQDLGGRLLVLGSPLQRNLLPGVTHEQALDYAADCLTAVLPVLEQTDTIVAVEPLGPAEGDFLNRTDDAVRLIERIGSPHCRLHLDCKAMSSEPEPIADNIRRHAPWLVHFHANDANKLGPGMGDVDFVPIVEALGQIDYQGWVSVEVFDYSPGVERLARESIEHLQACLEQVTG
ncbi:MAG: sugar phosphate isomerase/epimerase [Pirellulales bacterium]|nr:sugar phosphate isomerase/epimerase [Pirellulales bacterium]